MAASRVIITPMQTQQRIQPAAKPSERRSFPKPTIKEKGISRLDYERNHGYRAYIKFKGVEYQKYFGDGDNPEKALANARQWRKLKVRTLQADAVGSSPLKKIYSNNQSGITGVGRSGDYWQAAWVEKGANRNRKFSITTHGEREAFRLACRERAEAEKRLYGAVFQKRLQRYA